MCAAAPPCSTIRISRCLRASRDAPGAVGPFRIRTATDDVLGDVAAGVDILDPNAGELRLLYEGSFGELVEQHAAGVKATLPFIPTNHDGWQDDCRGGGGLRDDPRPDASIPTWYVLELILPPI